MKMLQGLLMDSHQFFGAVGTNGTLSSQCYPVTNIPSSVNLSAPSLIKQYIFRMLRFH